MGIRSFLFLVIHSLPIVLTEMLLIFSNLPLTDMRQSVVLVMPFPTACNESFLNEDAGENGGEISYVLVGVVNKHLRVHRQRLVRSARSCS